MPYEIIAGWLQRQVGSREVGSGAQAVDMQAQSTGQPTDGASVGRLGIGSIASLGQASRLLHEAGGEVSPPSIARGGVAPQPRPASLQGRASKNAAKLRSVDQGAGETQR